MTSEAHWVRWHDGYRRPGSSLQRRLRRIQDRVVQVLDTRPAGPIRALSMCAGRGQDLIGPLATHPRRDDVAALLVELDPENADAARRAAAEAGLDGVRVVTGDAADPAVYAAVAPVDLALVCGVFGNIPDDHIRGTIGYLPALLRPGGHVIWTRHRRDPDLTPTIRDWFSRNGFREVAFDVEPGYLYGVGTHALAVDPPTDLTPPDSLFTFVGTGDEAVL